uniref:Iodothyronine deiodinase n=1 Tax=Astatotilapia calliptera TaxID=8154 RepID=A0AAX7T2A6_ASTCA
RPRFGGGVIMNTLKTIKNAIVCLVLLPRFLVAAVMFWLLDFLCIRKRVFFRMKEQEGDAIDPPLCISDSNRLFSLESLKAVWHGHKLDFLKAAHLGQVAPNTEVVQLEDQRRSRILDYAQDKRPLILNFGSYIADSLVVYIEEAHPSDGWMSTDAPYQIPKHRCLEDRLNAAQLMHLEVPGSLVVVDSMENSSNAAYGAYFDRLYILQEGKIVYQGGRGPEGYRISELRDWLNRYRDGLDRSNNQVIHV